MHLLAPISVSVSEDLLDDGLDQFLLLFELVAPLVVAAPTATVVVPALSDD